MLRHSYDLIMNPSVNPLSVLPKTVRFKFMIMLSLMWSAVFTVWTGWIAFYGPSVLAHVVLLIGVFFTADIFGRSNKRILHHRDAMRDPRDGTAMHDDLWGAQ
ncbi:MAG: hypothetical protein ACR2PG_19320 [Hyphomicrobiaceae bacterium]